MIKIMFAAKRRDGITFEAFREYWLSVHADLMMQVPGLARYTISLAVDPSEHDDGSAHFDGFAEVVYPDAAVMRAAMQTPQAKAMLDDEVNLFDVAASVREVVTEHRVL